LKHLAFASVGFGTVTTTSSAFSNCAQLSRIVNCKLALTFTVASLYLGAAELDEIYTSLVDRTTFATETITVTGNVGTTGDTPSIATAKNWTVTG
jgi:hypothetical protein